MGSYPRGLPSQSIGRDHARVSAPVPRLLRLRRRSSRRRHDAASAVGLPRRRARRRFFDLVRSSQATSPVDCRRRAARAVPRAERDPAAAGANGHLHCSSSRAPCGRFPRSGRDSARLQIVVSIDGLQPEHDARRTPATYDRILKHIDGPLRSRFTARSPTADAPAGLHRGVHPFWSGQPTARTIWISLYTPQIGEMSEERLHARRSRRGWSTDLLRLRLRYPKLQMPKGLIDVLANAA